MKQAYSDYFEQSQYYYLLKKPLDNFFFVLEKHPYKKNIVLIDYILRHCIVFDLNEYIVVTPVSTHYEHD